MELKMKFRVKLQNNTTGTFNKLTQAFRDSILSRTQFFLRLHKAFLGGRDAVQSEPHSD